MKYRLLPSVRISESSRGSFLVASRPLRILRMNRPLRNLLGRGPGETLSGLSEAEARVLNEMVARGFAEREDNPPAGHSLPTVSIVIPVRDRAEELRDCLRSLTWLRYPREKLEIIVVDDGSIDGTLEVASRFNVRLVESGETGGGPARARNRGAAIATGDILAFIDSDCTASPEWLGELASSFADPTVAAVGGWVDGMRNGSALDRYEAVMSSLFLGSRERSGQAGQDTFYLPSCNLLVRRTAFQAAGGFRPELRVGEDVDLTWRLRDMGGKILYRPRGRVWHKHRSRLGPFLERRFQYGTSEGLLQSLHPSRRKRMVLPPVPGIILLLLGAALVGRTWLPLLPGAMLWLAEAALARLEMGRQGIPLSFVEILLAKGRALGSLAYYLGYHLVRYYLVPLWLTVAIFPLLGPAAAALLLWVGAVDYHARKPPLSPALFLFFYLLEQAAYGLGVFRGCLGQKNFGSYRLLLHFRPQTLF